MAVKKIEMNERNANNTGWDVIYPKTTTDVVIDETRGRALSTFLSDKKLLMDGSSTFNGTMGRIISHSIGHTGYRVIVVPTANVNGYLGEVWVEKASNSFKVCCSGTAATTFDYVVIA